MHNIDKFNRITKSKDNMKIDTKICACVCTHTQKIDFEYGHTTSDMHTISN